MSNLQLRRRVLMAAAKKPRLPREYQEVEYLESTGTQWIDTLRAPNVSDLFEQKFQLTSLPDSSVSWYGSMPSAEVIVPRTSIGVNRSTQFFAGTNVTVAIVPADLSAHTLRYQRNAVRIDDVQYYGSAYSGDPIHLTSYLFARHGNDGVQSIAPGIRIYYHKEYTRDWTPALDFVPCYRRLDRKPGMYELVTDAFFVNQGTGDFLLGPDVR